MKTFISIILLLIFTGTALCADIEVLRFDCKKTSESSKHYSCKVIIKNISGKNIKNIAVRIESIDNKGNLLDSTPYYGLGWSLDFMLPGQQSINKIYTDDNPEIEYFVIKSIIQQYPRKELEFIGKTKYKLKI